MVTAVLRRFASLAVDAAVAARPASPTPGRTLLVRPDGLGDFVLWLPAAAALSARRAPGSSLTLIAHASWAALAARTGLFDGVWEVDRAAFLGSPSARAALLRRVRGGGFATAIHPVYSREFLVGDALVSASGAPRRVGIDGDRANRGRLAKALGDRCYTELVVVAGDTEAERNTAFSAALGAPVDPTAPHPLLAVAGPRPVAEPYFLVAPGALSALRRWPAERFAAVAAALMRGRGLACVVTGTAADREAAARIASSLQGRARDLTGVTGVVELVTWVRHAAVVVANETGVAHIAAAVGTPAVVMAGGGHFGRFVPYAPAVPVLTIHETMPCYGCNWVCVHRPAPGAAAPCVERITVGAVTAALDRLTSPAGPDRPGARPSP